MSENRPSPMTNHAFWGLVGAMWLASSVPYVSVPFVFLATWVHELGHGLGAILSGGTFERMIIDPDFSGRAYTRAATNFQHMWTIIAGLLGPVIAGSVMVVILRRFGGERIMLTGLAIILALSGFIWAGNMFTRITVGVVAMIMFALAFKLPVTGRRLLAYIVAISLCLSAVSHFSYFFMSGEVRPGTGAMSDTQALANLMGAPHLFWACLMSVISILILVIAVKLSTTKS